jgi:hypothetical protein
VFGFSATQGPVSFEDRLTSIRFLGHEVLPAVREYDRELGLLDPFKRAPGARPFIFDAQREPVVSLPKVRPNVVAG